MWTRIAYFARETLVSLRRNVLMTIAGIATVAVSLSLFGGILHAVEVGRPRHRADQGRRELEIFMNVDATEQQIDAVAASARRRTANVQARSATSTRTTRTRSSSASSGATPTS